MTIINDNFRLSGNPNEDLKKYAQLKGISDEDAKQQLQEIYGEPTTKEGSQSISTYDLGCEANLDILSASANYNLASQNMQKSHTNIEKLLKDKGYQNISAIADFVGNAIVKITYGNGVPCLQVFDKNDNCVGHMYMDNFEENGENQKNKLIMYGNESNPTTVFKFNDKNNLEQIYDSNGKVTNIDNLDTTETKNKLNDIVSEDGMTRTITYDDGSVTEFHYNEETQSLETYDKKIIDGNGNMEILDYKNSQGVDRNPISKDDALLQLNDKPTFSVKSAKAFIDTSNFEFDKVEEFKNVSNIQIDYDSEGKERCLILLDSEGNRIGHMWLQDQEEYDIDNNVGNLYFYDSSNRYIFTPDGKLMATA